MFAVENPQNVTRNSHIRDCDLDGLTRIKALSWFSLPELSELAASLKVARFARHDVIAARPISPRRRTSCSREWRV